MKKIKVLFAMLFALAMCACKPSNHKSVDGVEAMHYETAVIDSCDVYIVTSTYQHGIGVFHSPKCMNCIQKGRIVVKKETNDFSWEY